MNSGIICVNGKTIPGANGSPHLSLICRYIFFANFFNQFDELKIFLPLQSGGMEIFMIELEEYRLRLSSLSAPLQELREALNIDHCTEPVSYTHLDVYKRQRLYSYKICTFIEMAKLP